MSHIHLIGIGGTGLSAIARVLHERGNVVSGSDLILSPLAQDLIDLGISISIGHKAENITGADKIICSSAIPDTNPEVVAAKEKGIPVLKRRDFLAELTQDSQVIAVAGTHGKTTTTAMIAWTLHFLGRDPSYIIGGTMKNTGSNAHAGNGKYFVIEADEYDRMFLGIAPDYLIITNIEHDHPDCFPTEEDYKKAFRDLINNITTNGFLILCKDHNGTANLISEIKNDQKLLTYGTSAGSDFQIQKVTHTPGKGLGFQLKVANQIEEHSISLSIPGKHNAQNAASVLAVMNLIGIPITDVKAALEKFKGTGRRFDVLGEINGITFIDDYAHHPTEIKATLSAARNRYPDRNIWAIWQPHTYSRTQELFDDFAGSFTDCDHVLVTEIYASREKCDDYSAKLISTEINHDNVHFIAHLKDVINFLLDNLTSGDVLVVMSAGDAITVNRELMDKIQDKGETND